jgi:hypothetical protein
VESSRIDPCICVRSSLYSFSCFIMTALRLFECTTSTCPHGTVAKAQARTPSVCPFSVLRELPVAPSQSRSVLCVCVCVCVRV